MKLDEWASAARHEERNAQGRIMSVDADAPTSRFATITRALAEEALSRFRVEPDQATSPLGEDDYY